MAVGRCSPASRVTARIGHHRVHRWIHVIAEVQTDRAYGCLVSQPQTGSLRIVIEVAGPRPAGRSQVVAGLHIRLMPTNQRRKNIGGILIHIAKIFENHKAKIVSDQWQRNRRNTQFRAIHKRPRTAHRIPGLQIAWTRGIHAETAMRRGAAGIEPFWQRNQIVGRIAISVLKTDARAARQNPVLLVQPIIVRLRNIHAIEICLRRKSFPGEKLLRRKIPPAGRVQVDCCGCHGPR